MHNALEIFAVIGIVGYVIGRQLQGEPQRGKRLILLPAILAVIGAVELGKDGRHPQTLDIVFIAVSAVVAAGIGVGQGSMMRLEHRGSGLWGQMPVRSLWLWAALVLSRVVIGVIAGASGAHVAASTAPILLVLGINRLAQAAAIAPRALRAGIPFAAEKDGSVFLGGTIRPARPAQPSAPSVPSDTTWQATGRQLAGTLGAALQERRDGVRERDDRRGGRRGPHA